jgi:hypothetical protein
MNPSKTPTNVRPWLVLLGTVGLVLGGCGKPTPQRTAPADPPEVPPPEELEYSAVLETPGQDPGGGQQANAPEETTETSVGPDPANPLVPPSERTSPLLTGRDFVTRWNLLGPLDADALAKVELSDADGTGELAGRVRDWRPVRAASRPTGWVDLGEALGRESGQAGLAAAWLMSPEEMVGCELRIGTTGPVEIYLNGRRVLKVRTDPRKARWDQDSVESLTLHKGRNVLLIRAVDTDTGAWGFFCRLTDRAGRPIKTGGD